MSEPLRIEVDDLRRDAVIALVREHYQTSLAHSPPECAHALDLDGMRAAEVTFWTVWRGNELAGCGAMRELSAEHAELKTMKTVAAHLRQGVASHLLEHMFAVARQRGYARLSLETGNNDAFQAARALYERYGFVACEPYADYVDNGFSTCMTRAL